MKIEIGGGFSDLPPRTSAGNFEKRRSFAESKRLAPPAIAVLADLGVAGLSPGHSSALRASFYPVRFCRSKLRNAHQIKNALVKDEGTMPLGLRRVRDSNS